MQVTALYAYKPAESDELGFQQGDVLRVLRVQEDGWWSGYRVKKPEVVGLFPSNYVQEQRSSSPSTSKKPVAPKMTRQADTLRQRIQQQPQRSVEPSESDEEQEEETEEEAELEPSSAIRGRIASVLQLRKDLDDAERASIAARDARVQAEREDLKRRQTWRDEREQREDDEEDSGSDRDASRGDSRPQHLEYDKNDEMEPDEADEADDDEVVAPQPRGFLRQSADPEALRRSASQQDGVVQKEPPHSEEEEERDDSSVDQHSDTAAIEEAAATRIARGYRRHALRVRVLRAVRRRKQQQRKHDDAVVAIRRWAVRTRSKQRERRQYASHREKERREREWRRRDQAAQDIQRWIRSLWACFWRRRAQFEREERAARELELKRQRKEQRAAERRRQQQEEAEEEGRRQQEAEAQAEAERLENERALSLASKQAESPTKPRRKVVKTEAVELIKALVQQQLEEALREHDAKMNDLQRTVTTLQSVVRKQTAMLQASTDQILGLQAAQQAKKPPISPDKRGAHSDCLLPRIASHASIPRQPAAPSGLRAPRPVAMVSKLPVLPNGRQESLHPSLKRK